MAERGLPDERFLRRDAGVELSSQRVKHHGHHRRGERRTGGTANAATHALYRAASPWPAR